MTRIQARTYSIFVFLGMGLVLLTRLVRPGLSDPQPWIGFLFGVLPNFCASLGIPFVLLVLAVRMLQIRRPTMTLQRTFLLCALVSLVGISIWEFTGGTIDAFDLLATLVGTACAVLAFLLFRPINPSEWRTS